MLQKVCIRLLQQKAVSAGNELSCVIEAHQLRWSKGDQLGDLERVMQSMNENIAQQQTQLGGNAPHPVLYSQGQSHCGISSNKKKFDRIVAADCLFFRDYHHDLIWLLRESLQSDGVIYLLQPQRDGTLNQFVDKASLYFDISVTESYSEEVSNLLYCTAL